MVIDNTNVIKRTELLKSQLENIKCISDMIPNTWILVSHNSRAALYKDMLNLIEYLDKYNTYIGRLNTSYEGRANPDDLFLGYAAKKYKRIEVGLNEVITAFYDYEWQDLRTNWVALMDTLKSVKFDQTFPIEQTA